MAILCAAGQKWSYPRATALPSPPPAAVLWCWHPPLGCPREYSELEQGRMLPISPDHPSTGALPLLPQGRGAADLQEELTGTAQLPLLRQSSKGGSCGVRGSQGSVGRPGSFLRGEQCPFGSLGLAAALPPKSLFLSPCSLKQTIPALTPGRGRFVSALPKKLGTDGRGNPLSRCPAAGGSQPRVPLPRRAPALTEPSPPGRAPTAPPRTPLPEA